LIATAETSYVYDGDGRRVEKCTEGTTPGHCASGATGTLYWRNTAGETLDETDLSGNPEQEYIFFDGQRIARRTVNSSGTTVSLHYYFSDHLGSHAVVWNTNGTACEQDADYYPFGGEENDFCLTPVAQNYKFTGKERDSESGLDNFGARYDASSLGRFMTPDNGSAQDSGNPQSWNLYSYVMNNPTTNVDPDGHDCIHINTDSGKFEGWDSGDCDNSTEEKANSGIYVDGTINSLQFNSSAGSLDFGYTAENGNVGAGTILGVAQPQKAAPINDPGMIPGMLGPGDLILFSGVKTPSVVTDALGKVLGSIFGKTVEETGAAVEDIVAKAGSSVGNQSIKASSRAAAEEAAEKWVGAGARPIMREGEQVGFVSADGTKVARWTSAGKPDPYINLTNNTTGGNLHVHF
jgi:RHS repeat-associated protein